VLAPTPIVMLAPLDSATLTALNAGPVSVAV
jgi:hypothetical protein